MTTHNVTICGGLPVVVEISWTRGDGWTTDDDFSVDEICWAKRDGSKGKPVSQAIRDRAEKMDPYFCLISEQASDQLAYEQWERERLEKGLPLEDEMVFLVDDFAVTPSSPSNQDANSNQAKGE